MGRRAGRGVCSAHVYGVVVHMVAVHMVHVPIMEVTIVIVMLDSLVTTAFSVLMIVLAVNFTRHLNSPYPISNFSKTKAHTAFNSRNFF
jgi:hypothetical protein